MTIIGDGVTRPLLNLHELQLTLTGTPLTFKSCPLVPWCDVLPNYLLWFTCLLTLHKLLSSL